MSMKQGIVTILGSDCEKNKAASIRRTLSADMSSKKWLEQNGFFSPVKKTASSEEVVLLTGDHDSSSSFSSEGEEECEEINNNPGQDDVWRMIQSQKEVQKTVKLDVNWGTVLTQKSENSVGNLLPPPYVHPLVKRSASAMSEKSLEICTESLGSETGADGWFSTYSNSEVLGDGDGDKEERTRVGKECSKEPNPFEDFHVVKYKSCPSRPIPPPLSSISGGDGVSLHIHSHRKNGRLVLEAVAVPPRKYFYAQRGDGRLVLSLINSPTSQLENEVEGNKVDEFEEVFGNMEEVEENIKEAVARVDEDNEEEDPEFFKEQNSKSLPNQMMSVHKSAVMMKRLMGLGNENPTWSHKFNKVVNLPDAEEIMSKKDVSEELPISHSLPPRPRMTRLISPQPLLPPPSSPSAATSFNAYEYFWRSKTAAASGFVITKNPSTTQAAPLKNSKIDAAKAFDQYQEMAPLMKGHKIEYVVPYFRGCNKEPRRSLPIREAYCIQCIATS